MEKKKKLKWIRPSQLAERWTLPTPSWGLNRALGGGFQSGRLHTIWGRAGSSKSSLALGMIANAQKMGKRCGYVDAEKTFDEDYASHWGVDCDELDLLVEGANVAETMLEALLPRLDDESLDVVVIDSLSSVVVESFYAPDVNPIGVFSRTSKMVINKILNSLGRGQQVFFISHASMQKNGQVFMLGPQLGNAQEHWMSTIVGVTANKGKDNFREDGYQKVSWKIGKTKQPVWPYSGEYYFKGQVADIDTLDEIFIAAKELDIVQGSSWLTFEGETFHGRKEVLSSMSNDPGLREAIIKAVEDRDRELRTTMAVAGTITELEDD